MLHILLIVWCAAAVCRALDVVGHIQWNDVCPNTTALGHARALLDEGIYNGSIVSNGNFMIPDVPDGTYILSIDSHDYAFDQYRIDVNQTSLFPVEVRPYVLGIPINPPSTILLSYPPSIPAKEKYAYFIPRQSFNLGGMLSNPMMLAMIVCGILVLAMPYIMQNLDLEEFKREQARLTRTIQGNANPDLSASPSSVDQKTILAPRINKMASNSKVKAGGKKGKR